MQLIIRTTLKTIRPIIYLLLLLHGGSAIGQDTTYTPGRWSFSFQAHTGFLMAHRPTIIYLQDEKAYAYEFSILKSRTGEADWHSRFNYPLIGFSYRYSNFGNSKRIGNAHALYPQLLLPLFHKQRLRVGVRFGFGFGYVEKPFDVRDNYKNLAIGSHLNASVLLGLQFRALIRKRVQISTGLDFYHLSNGAASIPNLGINLPSIYMGINYFSGTATNNFYTAREKPTRKTEITIYYAAGIKEKYPPAGPKYLVNVLNGQIHTTSGTKGLLGGGIEYMLDESLPAKLEDDGIQTAFIEGATRIGLFGSAGYRMGKWDGHFQTGFYLYNRYKPDGDLYSRIAIRHHFNQHLFATLNLKTHYAKADYAEWGIGYRL